MARGADKNLDVEELAEKYPSMRSLMAPTAKARRTAWVYAFTERPEAMEDLLSDMIKQAYAKPGRIGQRPMPKEEDVNLDVLLHGEYTEEPLDVSLPPLIKISQRAFCTKIHMNRRIFQRVLLPDKDEKGRPNPEKYHPDMETLQRIAEAVGKPPSYFLEWRQMAATAAFVNLITERPGIATALYRQYLHSQKFSPFLRQM